MFDLFRKIWVGLVAMWFAYYAAILAVAAIVAIANFAWLAIHDRFAEAATMYIIVAGVGAVIAFFVWVHYDATASSRRLEKYLRKTPPDEVEDDDEATTPPSELIRPAPGQDR